jgi:hypothetical protein
LSSRTVGHAHRVLHRTAARGRARASPAETWPTSSTRRRLMPTRPRSLPPTRC